MTEDYYKQYEPIFGLWRITRLIGEGSFSKVFEMEREDFGQVYKAALPARERCVRCWSRARTRPLCAAISKTLYRI